MDSVEGLQDIMEDFYPQFTQQQLIQFYVNFLNYIADRNTSHIKLTTEQKQLYALPDNKCNMILLLTRFMNSGTDKPVVDAAIVLLLRTASVFGINMITSYNLPRLLTTSLILANICFEDDYIPLGRWQRMSNCTWSLDDMQLMIYEQLSIIQYKLCVKWDEVTFLWDNILIPFYENNEEEMELVDFMELERRILQE